MIMVIWAPVAGQTVPSHQRWKLIEMEHTPEHVFIIFWNVFSDNNVNSLYGSHAFINVKNLNLWNDNQQWQITFR